MNSGLCFVLAYWASNPVLSSKPWHFNFNRSENEALLWVRSYQILQGLSVSLDWKIWNGKNGPVYFAGKIGNSPLYRAVSLWMGSNYNYWFCTSMYSRDWYIEGCCILCLELLSCPPPPPFLSVLSNPSKKQLGKLVAQAQCTVLIAATAFPCFLGTLKKAKPKNY